MNGKARTDSQAAGAATPPPRLSRAESRRLLAGQPVRNDRNLSLEMLLAAAAAPEPATSAPDEEGLVPVLAAFAAAPPPRRAGHSRHSSGAYPTWSRAFIVKCAAVLILLSGAGVAAAAADVLPGPVQHIAHSVFGELGVPAPQASPSPSRSPIGATPTQGPSPQADPTGTGPAGPTPTATGTSPAALCTAAAHSWTTWRTTLAPTALTQLIAAAGGIQNVIPYCAHVLGGFGGYKSTTSSASPTAAAPSASPTAVHGRRGYPTFGPTHPSTYDPTRYYKPHRPGH